MKKIKLAVLTLLLLLTLTVSANALPEGDSAILIGHEAFNLDILFEDPERVRVAVADNTGEIYYTIAGVTDVGEFLSLFDSKPLTQEEKDLLTNITYYTRKNGLTVSETYENLTDQQSLAYQNENKLELISQYTIKPEYSSYTRHFIILKNTSNETVNVSCLGQAFDQSNNLIGVENSPLTALGSGCTSIICEEYEVEGDIYAYVNEFNSSPSEYYESVLQDIDIKKYDISKGVVVELTNTGNKAVSYLKGYILFIKDNQLVDYEYGYFTDDDGEIKPQKGYMEQFNSNEEFDTVEVYLVGKRYIG